MHKKLSVQNLVYRLCVTGVLCCLFFALQAQEVQALKKQFNEYGQQTLQEKLYVHTDKNFYLAGEICWFKIYNVDAFFNKPLGISKVAYVEVLDKNNKPVLQAKVALKEGDGNGSLQLPFTLGSGNYMLRAYTRWMKNFSAAYFFEKPITVINTRKIYDGGALQQKAKYDIQFFPEGGNMVNGIQSKIAFRVVDQNGKGVSCSGAVVNDKTDTVSTYIALKFGMGSFLLTPERGRSYQALITLPDGNQVVQSLPAAYDKGYVMHLEKVNNQQLKITVRSLATDASSPAVYLFAHTRGAVKVAQSSGLKNGYAEFLIDQDQLGDGISHVTVFNADRQPVCERLFFKKPAQYLEIGASTDLPSYESRKKVTVRLSSTDQDNKPLPADMSMAVYRIDSLTMPDDLDISS
ncbi:MAG: hypothetical protein ABJB86_19065, partial [Bacteroidota bacterium]